MFKRARRFLKRKWRGRENRPGGVGVPVVADPRNEKYCIYFPERCTGARVPVMSMSSYSTEPAFFNTPEEVINVAIEKHGARCIGRNIYEFEDVWMVGFVVLVGSANFEHHWHRRNNLHIPFDEIFEGVG